MNQIIALCFYAGISLLSFGAVYTPSVLGYFAASPGIPLLFIAASLAACRTLLSKRPDGLSRETLLLVFSGIPLSLIGFFWYGVDARLLGKFCTLLILCFVWLSPLVCSSTGLYRSPNLKLILSLGLGVSVVAFVLSDYLTVLPQVVHNLVFSDAFRTPVDARPRGFMEEASHFAAYGGLCLLNLFLLRERGRLFSLKRFLSFSLILIGYLFLIGSKGSIIGVAIALLAIGMSWRRLHYLLLAIPGFYFLAVSQVQVLSADISQYTSVATRLGMGGAAVLGIVHNPFGYGYYGFYGAFAKFGLDIMEWLGSYLPLNLSEFADIMSSMQNISAKSTLLDFTLIFGIFFVYFLWRTLRRIDLVDTRVRFSLTYVFLVFLSNSGHLSLMFFLSLAVLVHNYPRAEKKPSTGRAAEGQALETPAAH
jgi:hypothetical protein